MCRSVCHWCLSGRCFLMRRMLQRNERLGRLKPKSQLGSHGVNYDSARRGPPGGPWLQGRLSGIATGFCPGCIRYHPTRDTVTSTSTSTSRSIFITHCTYIYGALRQADLLPDSPPAATADSRRPMDKVKLRHRGIRNNAASRYLETGEDRIICLCLRRLWPTQPSRSLWHRDRQLMQCRYLKGHTAGSTGS